MDRSLDVLIVGAGPMGCHHADAVRRVSAEVATLAGFVDPDPTALREAAEAREVPGYGDLDEALAAVRPDVVHVVAPPALHGRIALQALDAGAHLYVEKPFTLALDEAEEILERARALGRKVAAGHQLLMDPASLAGEEYLDSLGELRHLESYFAFRPRREVSGKASMDAVGQMLDILPHPTYVLQHFFQACTGESPVLRHLDANEDGSVNILVEAGRATGSLVVTLEGRPVHSFVRLIGTRGTLYLDYVRGIAIPKLWPGSALDKVAEPYHEAWRLSWGSSISLARRVLRRERSYPGLRPMFEAFYESIREDGPSPVSDENILFSVEVLEKVADRIQEKTEGYTAPPEEPTVVVTGGTGFLGKEVVRSLVDLGETPVVFGRRIPGASDRIPGAHYEVRDLAEIDEIEIPDSVHSVVHCAAETAGSWEAHQRNSIDATRNILEKSRQANVERFFHVSSLGVMSLKARPPISEEDPVDPDPRARGPYVWGKLESERLVAESRNTDGMATYIVRPDALVDPEVGPPPGRLGRPVGPFFVAIGPRRAQLPTTDVRMAGLRLAQAAAGLVEFPETLHLLDPKPLTRRDLIEQEKKRRPGTIAIWLPWPVVRVLSGCATVAQKLLRPRSKPVVLSSAFYAPPHSADRSEAVARKAEQAGREVASADRRERVTAGEVR